MDNNNLKKRLPKVPLILLAIAIGLSACKKEPSNQIAEPQKSFATKQETKIYLNQKLNQYGKIIAKLAQNQAMKKLVNERVSLKFDGDYNVLLNDLVRPQSSETLSLKKNLNMSSGPIPSNPNGPPSAINLQALEQALTEPLQVNGEILYPQIYIPFFEEQQPVEVPIGPIEPGDPGTPVEPDPCLNAMATAIPDYPNPVIVPYDGEEVPGRETFTGYTYDQNGTLIENISVDECFAKRHRVWAITLNERVNDTGNVTPPISGVPSPPTIERGADAYIPSMTIKENKESFIKGASEIYLIAAVSWENGINPASNQVEASFRSNKNPKPQGVFNVVNDVDYNFFIRDFSRKEIRRQNSININFTYFPLSTALYSDYDSCIGLITGTSSTGTNYNAYQNCKQTNPNIKTYYYPDRGDYVYFLIYEYDTGILNLNGYMTENIQANNNSIVFRFRSNENPYIATCLKISKKNESGNGSYTGMANFDNNEINFSSRIR